MEPDGMSGGDGVSLGESSTIVYNIDTGGIERRQDELMEFLTEWREATDHPLLTTPFADYTVTEGLLLLALLLAVVKSCVRMLKGGFSWLGW